jgi:hypothetical protein
MAGAKGSAGLGAFRVSLFRRGNPSNRRVTSTRPGGGSAGGDLPIDLADDVSHAFRPNLRGVLAIRRYLAMIAGAERFRSAVPGHRDLATQHHDAHVEPVRMEILCEVGLLAAMNDLEALTTFTTRRPVTRES